jgi:membrane-anchored protein YejM (alkaline phosphatase superfamily)
VTGIFADQNILNDHLGFEKKIYSEDISQEGAKHYHDDMEEINYFGSVIYNRLLFGHLSLLGILTLNSYSEREVYPYMEDAIDDAIKKNERLFLSHFTSTTHHPWALPKGVRSEQYFSDENLMGKHEDMNSYLNSVRFVDAWLGEMLGLLDKKGISNETLVVFVGDQ